MVGSILERVAGWPEEAQAELILSMVEIETKHFGVYRLSDEERAAVRESLAQAKRREFVPHGVAAEFLDRHRR